MVLCICQSIVIRLRVLELKSSSAYYIVLILNANAYIHFAEHCLLIHTRRLYLNYIIVYAVDATNAETEEPIKTNHITKNKRTSESPTYLSSKFLKAINSFLACLNFTVCCTYSHCSFSPRLFYSLLIEC